MPDSPKLKSMKSNLIKIVDQRNVDMGSGTKLGEGNRLSTEVDPQMIQEIVSKAKRSGQDPYTHLAMALRETSMHLPEANKYFPDRIKASNPFMVGAKDEFPGGKKIGEWMAANPHSNSVDAFNELYKNKMAIADAHKVLDEAKRIQYWNGTGPLANKGMQYGIDTNKTPINMGENPVYGKSIIDIRENVIKKNPELIKLVDSIPAAKADVIQVRPPLQLQTSIAASPLRTMSAQQLGNPLSPK